MAKRELLCNFCGPGTAVRDLGVGEGLHVVRGPLRQSAVCDACGLTLAREVVVFAVTTWTEGTGYPWFPWEDDVIDGVRSSKDLKAVLLSANGTGGIN